jgi:hypothetical protein
MGGEPFEDPQFSHPDHRQQQRAEKGKLGQEDAQGLRRERKGGVPDHREPGDGQCQACIRKRSQHGQSKSVVIESIQQQVA